MDPDEIKGIVESITEEIHQRVIGLDYAVRNILACFFANGHVLLEGVPGIAKSMMAYSLAEILGLDFKRIQFTPDLMPGDITGVSVFNMKNQEFSFIEGPVFSNIILCDEISRAPPKTQSALLEAMQERQVSHEGITYKLPEPFLVIATQNPIEQAGVYPLPEAQLDRFLIRQIISYPNKEAEIDILQLKQKQDLKPVQALVNAEKILKIQQFVRQEVLVSEKIMEYIVNLMRKTREHYGLTLGASPRASISLMTVAQARAAISGRDYLEPDDVKQLFFPVVNHRLILSPETEMDKIPVIQIIDNIIKSTEVIL
ncbi:MAG: MoxR family ATPase [Candidatus Heimdallarchaeota archaeon]|nr:MAG: MoxR family ATPase [Candidatus Heimdallarchaeota archaeon]